MSESSSGREGLIARDLGSELSAVVGREQVLTRYLDRIAYASDASVYRLVPRAVVQPRSIAEVQALFHFSRARRIPLTFRAAGTSLSGQAVTDGILVDVSKHWRKLSVEEGGRKVRVQPGVIGGVVNQHLRPCGAKIGPDPASINACMMGGILANNSSGMCCGVAHNAYHTLDSIRFVLPDGLVLDTSEPGAGGKLDRQAPALSRGLLVLRDRIETNPVLRDRIRAKYRMKNTMGYSLNAFVDFSRPLDILAHLMIGSEGTLGFIAEAVLNTIPDHPVKHTGLLFFPDVPSACTAIAPLRDSGARALELMDRASLRSIEDQPGVPGTIRELPPSAAALLVEYQCASEAELGEQRRACARVLPALPLASEPSFTRDPDEQAALWRVRKGLIPSVGAMRRQGTSFIIEDVVFPVETLAEAVKDLQALFAAHGYDDAIVFGHAKDGNLHFVLTQAFERPADVDRYGSFMEALATLVVDRHGGALKAEHGTGRNMAPFVAAEWGSEAYEIMKALKGLVDPDGLLNPGVILNEDPRAHLSHLKSLPRVEPEVDRCIECGFCERVCPSRDLTLTPRQRIVVRREMARLRELDPRSPLLRELEADYAYAAVDTCAADGMCATACPVAIDTGELVRRLRREGHSPRAQELAAILADRLGLLERSLRLALRGGHLAYSLLGARAVDAVARAMRAVSGGTFPRWIPPMPRAAAGRWPRTDRSAAVAVYFPTCVNRVVGALPGEDVPRSVVETLVAVAGRAGAPVWIPEDCEGQCCGMPFHSKGYEKAYLRVVNRLVSSLWSWSGEGRRPVVVDASPCAYTLRTCLQDLSPGNRERLARMRVLDSIEFVRERVLPRSVVRRRRASAVLHPVCSTVKMNLAGVLEEIARACSDSVTVPLGAGCCGFAGDRGLLFPELTEAATRSEADEVVSGGFDGHYSSSRTCEIALSRATGRPYRSFLYLVEEATRAPETA